MKFVPLSDVRDPNALGLEPRTGAIGKPAHDAGRHTETRRRHRGDGGAAAKGSDKGRRSHLLAQAGQTLQAGKDEILKRLSNADEVGIAHERKITRSFSNTIFQGAP